MPQSATERRAAQRKLAKSVKSGSMGPKSKIGAQARKVASSAKSAASSAKETVHTAVTTAKEHLSGDQFRNNSGSTTMVGGSSKGKHAGSYNHDKDMSSVAKTGDTAMGRHARGGPMSH